MEWAQIQEAALETQILTSPDATARGAAQAHLHHSNTAEINFLSRGHAKCQSQAEPEGAQFQCPAQLATQLHVLSAPSDHGSFPEQQI